MSLADALKAHVAAMFGEPLIPRTDGAEFAEQVAWARADGTMQTVKITELARWQQKQQKEQEKQQKQVASAFACASASLRPVNQCASSSTMAAEASSPCTSMR